MLAFLAIFVLGLTTAGCFGPSVGSVGALLGKDVRTGRLFVREVPPAMSAAASGLRDGDEVLAIDNVPVHEMSPKEVHQRLQGKIGTTVSLLVSRDGQTLKIDIVRGALAGD